MRTKTCQSGREDARFPDLQQVPGPSAMTRQIWNEYPLPSQYPFSDLERESKLYFKKVNISLYTSSFLSDLSSMMS